MGTDAEGVFAAIAVPTQKLELILREMMRLQPSVQPCRPPVFISVAEFSEMTTASPMNMIDRKKDWFAFPATRTATPIGGEYLLPQLDANSFSVLTVKAVHAWFALAKIIASALRFPEVGQWSNGTADSTAALTARNGQLPRPTSGSVRVASPLASRRSTFASLAEHARSPFRPQSKFVQRSELSAVEAPRRPTRGQLSGASPAFQERGIAQAASFIVVCQLAGIAVRGAISKIGAWFFLPAAGASFLGRDNRHAV